MFLSFDYICLQLDLVNAHSWPR